MRNTAPRRITEPFVGAEPVKDDDENVPGLELHRFNEDASRTSREQTDDDTGGGTDSKHRENKIADVYSFHNYSISGYGMPPSVFIQQDFGCFDSEKVLKYCRAFRTVPPALTRGLKEDGEMKRFITPKLLASAAVILVLAAGIVSSAVFIPRLFPSGGKDVLTRAEKDYLANRPEIVFAGQNNYPPFDFVGRNGEYSGIVIELIRWMATEFGFKAGFRPMNFSDAVASVREGRSDAMTGLFYSAERDEYLDFTPHMFTIPAVIFVKAERPDIRDLQGLENKTIAIPRADYAEEFLREKKIPHSVKTAATFQEAADLVIKGEADALIGDEQTVLYYLYSRGLSSRLKRIGEPLYEGKYCFGLKEGDILLQSILEKGLNMARERGVLNSLESKWIGTYFNDNRKDMIRLAAAIAILLAIVSAALLVVWFRNRSLVIAAEKRSSQLTNEISEHERTREALGDSEERFRTLCVNSTDSIFWIRITEDGRFIIEGANPAQVAALGQPEESIIGREITEILPPELSAPLVENYRQCAECKTTLTYDERVELPQGYSVWQTILVPQMNSQGRVFRIIGTARDITERKRTEDALRESEARNRGILENAAEIIYTLNREGECLYISPAFTRILGYDASEIIGRKIGSFLDPDDVPAYQSFLSAIMSGSGAHRLPEFRTRTRSGEIRYFTTTASIVNGPNGGFDYLVGVALDITDRKQLEAEHLDLERRLLHTQKLESLGVLAGGIAHDFNNLLSAIMGNLELAQAGHESANTCARYISNAMHASKKAADLTRQMLAYSGKGSFRKEELNLSRIVDENISIFRSSVPRTITLELDLASSPDPIIADSGQIQQVVMNLITNAAEAIGTRPGTLRISTGMQFYSEEQLRENRIEELPPPGLFVYLEISDTGCGMSRDTQQRLFDPFFTTKFTGRGLGMSALLGIVKGHHGAIFVHSELEKGSTFRILFPAAESERSEKAPDARPEPYPRSGSVSIDGRKILVIDDEQMVLEMCSNMLMRYGFSVLTAEDGPAGIELFKANSESVDCIILDLSMPRMDGLETFRHLRAVRPDVKVILSSGYSAQSATEPFKGLGLSGFVSKPYTIDTLRDEVERVLSS